MSGFLEKLAEFVCEKGYNVFSIAEVCGGRAESMQLVKTNRCQDIYSVSKAFVVTALGMLYDEGKLSPEDRIVDIFPEYAPGKEMFCPKGLENGKVRAFLENARMLEDAFGIVPLMYGSLGLSYLTGEDLQADDIDILVPRAFVTERWGEFCAVMKQGGYALIDEHEHEFEKDGVHFAYAEIDGLEAFAGVAPKEIAQCQKDGAAFRLMSLGQYLRVYMASAKDGYRVHVREKKDAEKIGFIRRCMQRQEEHGARWAGATIDMALRHRLGLPEGFLDIDCEEMKGFGKDLLAYLFAQELECAPGEKRVYTDGAYYLLGRVVERVAGMGLNEFLWERLFGPMEFTEAAWSTCPMGHAMGATGLYITTADMAKLGEMYLGGGVWRGKRLLSQAWVRMVLERGYEMRPVGIGGAYGKGGMYGQMLLVVPEMGRVVAWHAFDEGNRDEMVRFCAEYR